MRKKGSSKKQDKKKTKGDPDSHPLNLPPDELRRLSAAMAREENGKVPMDLDNDTQEPVTSPIGERQPMATLKETPGAFPEFANGVNGLDERSPTPPPHRAPPAPKVDAEACKAAGNKFFKAKDYERAIAEYTKGMPRFGLVSCNAG
jgi:DnaJ homolog subfamily C member 7